MKYAGYVQLKLGSSLWPMWGFLSFFYFSHFSTIQTKPSDLAVEAKKAWWKESGDWRQTPLRKAEQLIPTSQWTTAEHLQC